jgi:hypothetical protein
LSTTLNQAPVPQVLRIAVSQDGLGGNKRRVTLFGPTTNILDVGSSRSSPVLRLGENIPIRDDSEFERWIAECPVLGFVFHSVPAVAAHFIQTRFKSELESELLIAGLTMGRASIFLGSLDKAVLGSVVELLGALPIGGFLGWEEWRLISSMLDATTPHIEPVQPVETKLDLSASPNSDFRTSIEDARLSLNAILSHSQVYTPGETEHFKKSEEALRKFLVHAGLLAVERPTDGGDETRALQGQVTEFSSSLSYVDSQWYSGTSRIIAHPAQIRDQSLLGLGTACTAISKTIQVANWITEEAKIYHRFASLLLAKPFNVSDPRGWSDWSTSNVSEGQAPHIPLPEPRSPVVHFSARRGWRETEFSLSAPVSALRHGLSRAWHVRNVSHEWLHAHVRHLLDLLTSHVRQRLSNGLYSRPPGGSSSRKLSNRFILPACVAAGVGITDEGGSDAIDGGLALWYVLCRIAHRCGVMKSFLDRGLVAQTELVAVEEKAESEFTVPGVYHHALQLATEELTEIAVQILDLMYFYEGDEWEYLEGIWPAWSNIPIVHRRVGYYLRRLLAAMLSVKKVPNLHDLDRLRVKLLGHFESTNHHRTDLTSKASALLRSDMWGEEERPSLAERLTWVEAVRSFFHFDAFSSRSLDDRFIHRRAQGVGSVATYTLVPFAYAERSIQSPFVLLSQMQKLYDDDSLGASIWLFSQLASSEAPARDTQEDIL